MATDNPKNRIFVPKRDTKLNVKKTVSIIKVTKKDNLIKVRS